MSIAIPRGPLALPSASDIRIGRPVAGLTVAAIARDFAGLLGSRALSQSQAVVQVGNWRTAEGAGGTPDTDEFRVFHLVGPLTTYVRVAFWYTRDEEKPSGAEEVEIVWKDSAGTTFAATTWGDDALEATEAGSVRAEVAGVVRTAGALIEGREGYGATPLDASGSDPDPRLVDVSAYRGQLIELVFSIFKHRIYSVHVSDVAVDAY